MCANTGKPDVTLLACNTYGMARREKIRLVQAVTIVTGFTMIGISIALVFL